MENTNLRDDFAKRAMEALIVSLTVRRFTIWQKLQSLFGFSMTGDMNASEPTAKAVAAKAYQVADAMLDARSIEEEE